MKKTVCALLILAVLLTMGSGCSPTLQEASPESSSTAPPPPPQPVEEDRYQGEIQVLEINQALSYGLDQETGALYLMDSFVAGKDTAVFARLSLPVEEVDPEGKRQSLTILREGREVGTYAPTSHSTPDSLCFSVTGQEAARLTAGEYQFAVRVDDATGLREVVLRESASLRILAVPIYGNFGGELTQPEEGWQDFGWHIASCYPLANDAIQWDTAPLLDLTDSLYDMTTQDGLWEVWLALESLIGAMSDYDLVLGFVSGWMGEARNIGGYTYGLPANIINADLPCAEAVISHEVAHCYLVGDEYSGGVYNFDVNYPPYQYSGTFWYFRDEWITSENTNIPQAFDFGLSCSGGAVLAEQIPLDVPRMRQMESVASLMCGCDATSDEYWITSAVWEQLYKALTVTDFPVETGFSGGVTMDANEELQLFCGYCYTTSPYEQVDVLGRCTQCLTLTLLDPEGEAGFSCQFCGLYNQGEVDQIYLMCPYQHCLRYLRVKPGAEAEEDYLPPAYGSIGAGSAAGNLVVPVVRVSGILHRDGEYQPLPWMDDRLGVDSTHISQTGQYSFVFTGEDGAVLNRFFFTPDFHISSTPPQLADKLKLDYILSFPEETAAISLYGPPEGVGKGGSELLWRTAVSPSAPTVRFVGLAEGEALSGLRTVAWQGEDPDGDRLFYEVYFGTPAGTVRMVYSGYDSSAVVDMSALPQADQGMFLIWATDGIRASYDLSPEFQAMGR